MAGHQRTTDAKLPFERFYLGSAKVNINNLRLADPNGRTSHIAQKPKIDNLLRRFASNGCDRLLRVNHIRALVSKELLEEVLVKTGYSSIEQLKLTSIDDGSIVLDLPSLFYYDGQARVGATRAFFSHPIDRWWVVDFYDKDIGPRFGISERARNNESTRNAAGVVFREYLDMVARKDETESNKLALGLSVDELKEAKSICKRPGLMNAFISLKDIPGLWSTLKGGLHRSSSKGCDEELIHYLYFIRDAWLDIVTDRDKFVEIDTQTIELLESRAPGISYKDREHVRRHMRTGILFPTERDKPTRARLESKLMSMRGMIPSIATYSKDTMHLHEIVKVLRLLLGSSGSRVGPRSIRSALRKIWTGPHSSTVLHLEDGFDGNVVKLKLNSGNLDCFETSLQGIVLFAMRNYTMMINVSAKTIPGQKKASVTEPNPRYLYLFAKTARALGFHSDQIDLLLHMDYVRQLLEGFLEKVAPQECWIYDFNDAVERLSVVFQQLVMEKRGRDSSELKNAEEVKIIHRCGRPLVEDSTVDSDGLYLRNIIVDADLQRGGVTSSFIRSEFFRRFWDPPNLNESDFSIEVGMAETLEDKTRRPSIIIAQSRQASGVHSNENFETLERELALAREEIEDLRQYNIRATAHLEDTVLSGNISDNIDSSSVYSNDPIVVEWGLREEDLIAQYVSQLAQSNQQCDDLRRSNEIKDAALLKLEVQIARAREEMTTLQSSPSDGEPIFSGQGRDEVDKYIARQTRLELQLEDLESQLISKDDRISSLEAELSEIQQSGLSSGEEEERQRNIDLLEKRIKDLKLEIAIATARCGTIPKLKEPVIKQIKDLGDLKSATEVQASDLMHLETRLQNLNHERKSLREDEIPTKEKQLVGAEFDLYELKHTASVSKRRGEALFFDANPISGKVTSNHPTKVFIRADSLEKKFKDLLERGYVVWCFIKKVRYQIDLSDPLQWKSYLASPQYGVDGLRFYTKSQYKHAHAIVEQSEIQGSTKRRRVD